MDKSYDKYFVIGFNKTATSTFHNIFVKNNLKSQHTDIWSTDKYTCFSDNGNGNNYRQLDSMYNNAIFILNVRELDKWLVSRFKHGLRTHKKNTKSNWAYPCTYEKCKKWIYYREQYHIEILNYFSDRPNKLIIVNIDRPGWINYICSQLHFKNKNIDSKNVNKTNENNQKHVQIYNIVNQTLEKHDYDKKTVIFPNNELLNKYITIYNNYI